MSGLGAEEEDEEEEAAAPKTEKKTVWEWELLNDNKAIWLRPSSDVTDEEYGNFYRAIAKVRCRMAGAWSRPCTAPH